MLKLKEYRLFQIQHNMYTVPTYIPYIVGRNRTYYPTVAERLREDSDFYIPVECWAIFLVHQRLNYFLYREGRGVPTIC